MAQWRGMQAEDIAQVMEVANRVHSGLPERAEVFAERQRLFPRGCWVLAEGAQILGYGISHPIAQGRPPALDSFLGALPTGEAVDYYIHDVALDPSLRGSGLARHGVEAILQVAADYPRSVLVSVYGTTGFWERFGFTISPEDMGDKLAPYGEDAVFMTR